MLLGFHSRSTHPPTPIPPSLHPPTPRGALLTPHSPSHPGVLAQPPPHTPGLVYGAAGPGSGGWMRTELWLG